jgi:hypothetical protein
MIVDVKNSIGNDALFFHAHYYKLTIFKSCRSLVDRILSILVRSEKHGNITFQVDENLL